MIPKPSLSCPIDLERIAPHLGRGRGRRQSWLMSEDEKYIILMKKYGRDFQKIADELGTRSRGACEKKSWFLLEQMRLGEI